MASRALWSAVALAVGACGPATDPEPESRGSAHMPGALRRAVLVAIPAGVDAVAVADREAIGAARTRAVIDVLRTRWPTKLGCAIDRAFAADHAALGVTRAGAMLLVIAEIAPRVPGERPAPCDALATLAVANGIEIRAATFGQVDAARSTAPSVIDDPRFERALPYLAASPIAVVRASADGLVIATATPQPLEGWLAIDLPRDATAEHAAAVLGRMRHEVARLGSALASVVELEIHGSQVLARVPRARADSLVEHDVAAVARAALAFAPPATPAWRLECRDEPWITSCGEALGVQSLSHVLASVITARLTPIARAGEIAGLELAEPALGLRAGDRIVAVAGRRVEDRDGLVSLVKAQRRGFELSVERAGAIGRFAIVEWRGWGN